eukprot:TRINITY_DN14245_c0_g1_i2.p2 TRINITY_DN14245_c0_g1~~TRINITY_DN14245_c0_g1_i2.p2  ORF type:complete len:188 (-),score=3.38 TRINITY_DN14245_c0_g1_i2:4-567(-)
MGKSSLLLKTKERLESKLDFKGSFIDLSIEAMSIDSAKFFTKLLVSIYEDISIDIDLNELLIQYSVDPPHIVFQNYIKNIHTFTKETIVIFLDEIDSLFRETANKELTINLFSTIRSLYNCRSVFDPLNNIVFCMAGVLPPNKLLGDPYSTPYNIGVNIKLGYIEKDKFRKHIQGFKKFKGDPCTLR